MHPDIDLVRLCAATYSNPSLFDYWFDGSEPDGIIAGIKGNTLVCQGTTNFKGWVRDGEAFTYIPEDCPQLGPVHIGFDRGLREFLQKTSHLYGDGVDCTGHSLGAPHCELVAGRLITQGRPIGRIASFAPPRAGCEPLGQLLASVPKGYYKNRVDPITDMPLPTAALPYIHLAPFTMLDVKPEELSADPAPWLDFNLPALLEGISFEDHHIELYQRGVEALFAPCATP